MIPIELLQKYNMKSLEEYKKDFGDNAETEKIFYKTFLSQTDHIPNKIIESQTLGIEINDYTDILNYRQTARDKINELTEVTND